MKAQPRFRRDPTEPASKHVQRDGELGELYRRGEFAVHVAQHRISVDHDKYIGARPTRTKRTVTQKT